MHGRRMPALLLPALLGLLSVAGLLPLLGCGDARSADSPAVTAPTDDAPAFSPAGAHFDSATVGAITGRVRWSGEPPRVPSLRPALPGIVPESCGGQLDWPNPHAPVIDPATGGLRDAVVYLRGIDPARGRPWDHGPVVVRQINRQLRVTQDGHESRVGFARRGDRLEMLSEDATFYALHAGGAAYFTLTFPDPGRPRRRPLPETGEVELTSAAGQPWMRGHLFVDDHPYYARTDAAGRYSLPAVPSGRYEAVCWLPDPRIARHERDPECGVITRITFAPARRQTRPVEVAAGQTNELNWDWGPP